MKKTVSYIIASVTTGAIVAIVYFAFSLIVEELQQAIWFTLFDTENNVWLAVPISVIGGISLAALLRYMHVKGYQDIGHTIRNYSAKTDEISIQWVLRSLLIGVVSLVAGASLGPEAILLPVSYAVSYMIAKKLAVPQPGQFAMIGIIVLLAAFFNSYAAALIPLILLTYKNKTKNNKHIIPLVVLSVIAIAVCLSVLHVLHEREGYVYLGPIAAAQITPILFATAIIVAAVTTLIPLFLDTIVYYIRRLVNVSRMHWLVSGTIAGFGVGILYFMLGPVAFFSGHTGLGDLLRDNSEYTAIQLIGLAIGKLLVTAWSLATIYRGGVVFPQLLVGMSLALLISGGVPDNNWLYTLLVSSFFGIFVGSLGSLVIAAAFIFSLFGLSSAPFVIAAIIGSYTAKRIMHKQFAAKNI